MKKLRTFLLAIFVILTFQISTLGTLLDTSFNPGSGAGGGIVEQVLPLSDGRILVCGNFTSFNGAARSYIVRLNANGSVDESFLAHPGYWVRHMEVQQDGKIVIGGYFTTVEGQPRNRIARLNPNGSLDTSFNVGSGATTIIAGGIDGNIDPFVFWLAIQPDGKVIITGNFREYNGASSWGIARLNSDGSRDASFNVGAGLNSWGRHLLIQPNGQILVSGWFTSYDNQSFNRLVRLNPDGSADHSFNPFFGDKTAIYSTALVGGGKIVAAGHSLNDEGLFRRELERLNADGSVDSSFVGRSNDKTETLAVQSDGKIIIAGSFTRVNDTPVNSLARLNPDGTLDDSFLVNVDNFIWSAVLQSDGKLLIGGGFNTVDGVSRVGVARILTGSGGNPPPPTDSAPNLNVTGVSSSSITLGWSDSVSRASYAIEQLSSGSYVQVGTASARTRSFTVSGLSASTSYTFRVKAVNFSGSVIYSNPAGASTSSSSGGGGGGPNSAAFVNSDSTTQGSWKGVYGAEGYNVIGEAVSYPSYASVTPLAKSDWVWQYSTDNRAAVQRANGSDRIAACWYSASSYSVDLRFSDSSKHRVAFYFLDWDLAGRNQTVQITDGDSGTVLDTKNLTGFGNGVYLVWDLGGHVKVTITPANVNGVLSGIFFGGTGGGTTQPTVATPIITPAGGSYSTAQQVSISTATRGSQIRYTLDGSEPTASSALYGGPFLVSNSTTVKAKGFATGYLPSATASAQFTISTGGGGGTTGNVAYVGNDSNTKGNWRGIYGGEGYNIPGKSTSYPAYAQVSASGKSDWVWNDPTGDTRGLLYPDGSSRLGSCWYSGGTFDVNINITDGRTHRVSIYVCDWDYAGRSQSLQLIDPSNGSVLQSYTISRFQGGNYMTWDVKGRVTLRFTKGSGPNSIVNGLFFDASPRQL